MTDARTGVRASDPYEGEEERRVLDELYLFHASPPTLILLHRHRGDYTTLKRLNQLYKSVVLTVYLESLRFQRILEIVEAKLERTFQPP